ncbi:MAG: hypothetical protein IJA62_00850 [Ruminococcus sp.]|nr:hypothetical protein [Ruminococcus sp.]
MAHKMPFEHITVLTAVPFPARTQRWYSAKTLTADISAVYLLSEGRLKGTLSSSKFNID